MDRTNYHADNVWKSYAGEIAGETQVVDNNAIVVDNVIRQHDSCSVKCCVTQPRTLEHCNDVNGMSTAYYTA